MRPSSTIRTKHFKKWDDFERKKSKYKKPHKHIFSFTAKTHTNISIEALYFLHHRSIINLRLKLWLLLLIHTLFMMINLFTSSDYIHICWFVWFELLSSRSVFALLILFISLMLILCLYCWSMFFVFDFWLCVIYVLRCWLWFMVFWVYFVAWCWARLEVYTVRCMCHVTMWILDLLGFESCCRLLIWFEILDANYAVNV